MFTAFILTLIIGLSIGGLVILMALPIALLCAQTSQRGSAILLALGISWFAVPVYIQAAGWSAGFGMLGWWTVTQVAASNSPWLAAFAVTWIHASGILPIVLVLLVAALKSVPSELAWTAYQDGGSLSLLRYAIWPHVRIAGLLSFLIGLGTITGEMLITNLYQVPTLTEKFYLDSTQGEPSWQGAVVATLPCVLIAVVAFLVVSRCRTTFATIGQSNDCPPFHPRLLLLASLMIYSVIIGLPVFDLVVKSGWSSTQLDASVEYGWQWTRFVEAMTNVPIDFAAEIKWSLTLSLFSATVTLMKSTVILGLIVSFRWCRWILPPLLVFAFAIPGPALFWFTRWEFSWIGIQWHYWVQTRTLLESTSAIQYRSIPIIVAALYAFWSVFNQRNAGAATTDQLSAAGRLALFYWQQRTTLIMLWLLAACIAVAEFSASKLLLPPGVSTLSSRIFELLHYGVRYRESALCLAMLATTFLVGYGISIVLLRKRTIHS